MQRRLRYRTVTVTLVAAAFAVLACEPVEGTGSPPTPGASGAASDPLPTDVPPLGALFPTVGPDEAGGPGTGNGSATGVSGPVVPGFPSRDDCRVGERLRIDADRSLSKRADVRFPSTVPFGTVKQALIQAVPAAAPQAPARFNQVGAFAELREAAGSAWITRPMFALSGALRGRIDAMSLRLVNVRLDGDTGDAGPYLHHEVGVYATTDPANSWDRGELVGTFRTEAIVPGEALDIELDGAVLSKLTDPAQPSRVFDRLYLQLRGFESLASLHGRTVTSGSGPLPDVNAVSFEDSTTATVRYGEEVTIGQVVAFVGDVEVKQAATGLWGAAQPGMAVDVGTVVQTGFDSSVTLCLFGGGLVTVEELSQVNVEAFFKTPTEVLRTRLGLRMGQLNVNVEGGAFNNDFQVAPVNAGGSVRGTLFTVTSTNDEREGLRDQRPSLRNAELRRVFDAAVSDPGSVTTTFEVYEGTVVVTTLDGAQQVLESVAGNVVSFTIPASGQPPTPLVSP